MKVIIKQFQSLESVSMEVEGFTVITGTTNIGKSALCRAIAAAVFGSLGDHYIRYGSVQCGVGISDTGLKLKWYKTVSGKAASGKTTSLEINGVQHTKIGKEQAALTVDCGFREVETSGPTLRPQIAMQHDSIFLLAQSATIVAEVLKLLGRADVVTEAQRKARKDCKEIEAKVKIREQDVVMAQSSMEELGDLDKWVANYEVVLADLCNADRGVEQLKGAEIQLRKYVTMLPTEAPRLPVVELKPKVFVITGKLVQWVDLRERVVPAELVLKDGVTGRQSRLRSLETLMRVVLESEQLKRSQLTLDQEASRLVGNKEKLEKELGVCPICGRSFGN